MESGAERGERIVAIVEAALQQPQDERPTYLRAACQGDDGLLKEVAGALQWEERMAGFLLNPAYQSDVSSPAGASSGAGTAIGPYRLLQQIGEGGMAEVWLAEQISPVHRRVALKLIKTGMDTKAMVGRFESERQALALMEHPSIAKVFDAGSTAEGRPYFVMEYVPGLPITGHCDKHQLTTRERLELFILVCEGVQHAHQKAIIHRDLKPSNILVSVQDGKAVPKIIDFGVAKAIALRLTEKTMFTEVGVLVGTPEYMSPEQADLNEHNIDTRTDVYSLGLMLYELLVGALPFDAGELRRAGFTEILRRVREEDPLRPSAKVRTLGDLSAVSARNRKTEPRMLARQLKGDLDWITIKALEKDRTRRYGSPSDLAAEIGRHLRDEPVQASPPSMAYRTRKFARRHRFGVGIGAGAMLLLVAFAVSVAVVPASFIVSYFYPGRTPKLTDRDTIVLADFLNTTGDSVFDGTLRQGLAVQLEQSPFLSLISDEHIQQTLRLMGRPSDAPLSPDVAREICERTASAAVLDGSIELLGSQYVLGLRAKSCRTGDILDLEQAQAAKKEAVLNALSQIASKFRTRVGESLATVEKHSTPLAEATTASLEALKVYSKALSVVASSGPAAALPLFKHVTEIDPQFAMAHELLGRVYGDIGESGLSAESTSRAYQLRDRTSDREKFWITASYDTQVTGNLEKAQETAELWTQTYPRDTAPRAFLAGMIYPVFGKYEKALEECKKLIDLDPDYVVTYTLLAYSFVSFDRLGEAENVLRRASERKLEMADLFVLRYQIAFLRGDQAGMKQALAQGQGKTGAEDGLCDQEAFALAYSGQLQRARKKAQRASDLARQSGHQERAALYETGAAVWEAFFGNASAARRSAMDALKLSKGRDVEYGAAFALALSGDSPQSQTLANDLEKRFPEDTSVRFSYLPALRALLALNRNEPAKGIELLQIALAYDLGAPPSSFFGYFGTLYPVYVRGEAYLAARKGAEAASEFEKILQHPGFIFNDPVGALAHLQFARALVLAGDKIKARTAYQDFLILWKDADIDIPILKQAKAEYARLQ